MKRLEKAGELKEQARKLVEEKNFEKAIQLYESALMVCHPSYFGRAAPNQVKEMIVLTNMLLNNLSLCYFNIKEYQRSLSFAEQVLITDPKNVKSHYRKGLCYKNLGDLERAFNSLKEARNICMESKQNNPSIFQEFENVKTSYKEYLDKNKEKEKLLYSKMLSSKIEQPKSSSDNEKNNSEKKDPKNEKDEEDEQLDRIVSSSLIILPTSLLGMVLCHYGLKMNFKDSKMWLATALLTSTWSAAVLVQKKWIKALLGLLSIGVPFYFFKKLQH